jgi:hypothetical protein
MTDVTVEAVEITDLGAQARGNQVFGVSIGDDTRLSFETTPEEFNAAITFCLIGVVEGLRYAGRMGVVTFTNGATLAASDTGGLVLTIPGGNPDAMFETWPDALNAAFGVLSG